MNRRGFLAALIAAPVALKSAHAKPSQWICHFRGEPFVPKDPQVRVWVNGRELPSVTAEELDHDTYAYFQNDDHLIRIRKTAP